VTYAGSRPVGWALAESVGTREAVSILARLRSSAGAAPPALHVWS
jgi:hypothetical protein